MGRILAIDYGNKRIGLAVTDENRMIATALDTVRMHETMTYIEQYIKNENVDCFVVGLPMRMNNVAPDVAANIDIFIKKLKKAFPHIPVERYDERFTSKMALQTMIDAGLKKKDRGNKELIDKISATIILQSYLEFLDNKH